MLQMSYGDDHYGVTISFLRIGVYILDVYTGYAHINGDFYKREVTGCRKLVIDPDADVLQKYKHLLKSPSGFDIFLTDTCSESLIVVSSLMDKYNCRLVTEFDNSFYPLISWRYSNSRSVIFVQLAFKDAPDAFVGDLFDDLLLVDEFGHGHFILNKIEDISEENRKAIHQLFKNNLTPHSRIYSTNHASINIDLSTYEKILKIT